MPIFNLYRGDTRPPGDIKRDGFRPIAYKNNPTGPTAAQALQALQQLVAQKPKLNDLQAHISWSKDRDYVSFAENQMGAYENYAYVYQVTLTLNEAAFNAANGFPPALGVIDGKWPTLLYNGATIAASTILAVRLNDAKKEVTFITDVPAMYVPNYREGGIGKTAMTSMGGIVASPVKKLW